MSPGLPVIELDAIFWLPNWKERDHDEMLQIVKTRIAEANDGWIVDGNYRKDQTSRVTSSGHRYLAEPPANGAPHCASPNEQS